MRVFGFLRLAPVLMLCFAVVAGFAGAGRQATAGESASDVVRAVSEKGLQEILLAEIPNDQKIERFRSLFSTYFDLPAIGRFVLGRYWRAGSEDDQAHFIDIFREINVYTWSRRFKDYNGQKLQLVGEIADGEKGAFVDTKVEQSGGQPPITVRWRLRLRDDGWRVVDLIVEGASMAITYRSEYNSLMSDPTMTLGRLNSMLGEQLARLKSQEPT